jgi:hypothetical protein
MTVEFTFDLEVKKVRTLDEVETALNRTVLDWTSNNQKYCS